MLQPVDEALVVPQREVILLADDRDRARHPRGFAQPRVDGYTPLPVELGRLPEEVDAIEEAHARGVRGRNAGELLLDGHPYGHRIDEHGLAAQARHEQGVAVRFLNQAPKRGRDLQPPLLVYPG